MALVQGSSSSLPAIGMLAGLLLLSFAGVMVVMPSSWTESAGRHEFLGRQLAQFGYITTSRAPSSFDSSDSSSIGSSLEPSKSSMSGSMESSEWDLVWPKLLKSVGGYMATITVSLAIQVIFAVLYFRAVTAPLVASGPLDTRMMNMPDSGGGDFSNGICDCYKDPWVCLQGICCPMVRIAHTNAVSGVCPFWESLWCWCCCAWMTLNIGPACLLIWWRLRLKSVMKVEENPITDFCITLMCPVVSVCQMGSAADNAMGYKVTGCCEYTPYGFAGGFDG